MSTVALIRAVLSSWRQASAKGASFGAWRDAITGKASDAGEPFAEADPALPGIEQAAIAGLLSLWRSLGARTLRVLGLDDTDKSARKSEQVFAFDATRALHELGEMEEVFIQAAGSERGPLVQNAYRAWVRGLRNAAAALSTEAAVDATRALMVRTIKDRAMKLVRKDTIRALREDIIEPLAEGIYDGMNPRDVARKLRQRFDAHDYDWERLARSELAQAQVEGKEAQYIENEIEDYDYSHSEDSRVSRICRDLAAAGPYKVGKGPLPMRDSHPNCRCTTRPRMD